MNRVHASTTPADASSQPDAAIPEEDPRVIEALEEYLSIAELGLVPDRPRFLARYAEIADALAPCLDGLDLVRRPPWPLEDERVPPCPTKRVAALDELPKARLSEFRILRELGRGGMGVVYEAEQISSGLRVALKVLACAGTMDRRQELRFHTEILAGARLDHPGIVPVLASGSEHGVPFYAMRLIDGENLAARIARLRQNSSATPPATSSRLQAVATSTPTFRPRPSDPSRTAEAEAARLQAHREVAQLGLQAARALAHAHDHGVIHRDIKPANLLLDKEGRLHVSDFGLARMPDNLELTITGDLLGTIRYMSPEQARGRRGGVDARSDQYSLGATLYELLTLRPAVEGNNAAEVLRKILQVPPVPPRVIDPTIPRPLEAILLKTLAREPRDRYDRVGDLAEDLQRFLADQPVRASEPSVPRRLRRWVRERRVAHALGAAGLGLLALGFVAGSSWSGGLSEPAVVDRDARDETAERSRRNLELALRAVVALEGTDVEPGPLPTALELYRRLAVENTGDDASATLVAAAHRRAGDLGARLESIDVALESYDRATLEIERLIRREPEVLQHQIDLATVLNKLGGVLLRAGRLEEAEGSLRRSLAILSDLAARHPEAEPLRDQLIESRQEFGTLLAELRRGEDADDALDIAPSDHRQLSTVDSAAASWRSARPASSS